LIVSIWKGNLVVALSKERRFDSHILEGAHYSG
jgi:hypothetical protein